MGNQFGLVDAHGDAWKRMKKSTSGAFSLGKMKKSLSLYTSCCKEMINWLDAEAKDNAEVDCVDMIKRYAINTLGSVGFGMNINTFKDRDNELKIHADTLFDVTRFGLIQFLPKLMAFFKVKIFSKKASEFIVNVVEQNIKSRAKENSDRKDILGTMIKFHNEHPEEMTKDILVKTCIQFMVDGYTTTAESIIITLYMIAVNPNVEEKLRSEIDRVLEDKDDPFGDLTDEDINELNYLDMVFKETMRMAVLASTLRQCTKAWKVPNSDLVIPEGTVVVIPIGGLGMDPKYWDEPEEFNPERFSEENKGKIRSGTYFPFGQGPRICLGNNFARFEAKVMLIYILRNYTFSGGENLCKELSYSLNDLFFPVPGLKLKFKKRNI